MEFHNLQAYKDVELTTGRMIHKLGENIDSVVAAIVNNKKEELAEKLLDVMQCCMGIAFTRNIDLHAYIDKHNKKLLNENHVFLD